MKPTTIRKKINTTEAQRKQFYKENPPILLPNSNFRYYRIFLKSGTMVHIKRKITKPSQLQKICIQHTPIAVYCSCSFWLDPANYKGVRTKTNYKYAYKNFLYADFVLDIDTKDQTNKEKAITTLNKIFPNKTKTIVKTGNGYHIHIHDYFRPKHALPSQRYKSDKEQRKQICQTLTHSNINFDYITSTDPSRLIRVPNTLHQNGKTIQIENTINPKS